MKHPISALSLLIGGLMIMPTSQASESWFEVELILFERIGETTKQQFKDPFKQFSVSNSIRIVDDAFYGVTKPCPALSQFERFSLMPEPELESETENSALVSDLALSTNEPASVPPEEPIDTVNELLTVQEIEIIDCIAPDDSLLLKAFDIRTERQRQREPLNQALDMAAESTAPNGTQSLAQQLTSEHDQPFEQAPEIDQHADAIISDDNSDVNITTDAVVPPVRYNPDIYVPYPETFNFNGVSYRSITAESRKYQTPLTVFQPIEETPKDDTVTEPSEGQGDTQPVLMHNPDSPYLLDESRLEMTALVKKMRWQKAIKPMLHVGWRQPTLARHLAKPIHLFAGEDYSQTFNENGEDRARLLEEAQAETALNRLDTPVYEDADITVESELLIQPLPTTNIQEIVDELSQQQEPEALPIWRLDGFLTIYLNHYLFIETDFDLRKIEQVKQLIEIDDFDNQTDNTITMTNDSETLPKAFFEQPSKLVNQLTSHPMKQHRRVRSKEIHYFDHANMGMIIQIRRFKIPEPKTDVNSK